jgi:hypothetical protein
VQGKWASTQEDRITAIKAARIPRVNRKSPQLEHINVHEQQQQIVINLTIELACLNTKKTHDLNGPLTLTLVGQE